MRFLLIRSMDYASFCDPSQSVIQILNLQAIAVCDFRRPVLVIVLVTGLIFFFSGNTLLKTGKIVVLIIAYFRRKDFTGWLYPGLCPLPEPLLRYYHTYNDSAHRPLRQS